MVGARVRWKHLHLETKQPVINLTGEVVAVSLTTNREWRVLVKRDDGSLESHGAENLIVEGAASEIAEAARESMHALEYLERYLEEQFPDTDHGGGPVEWATSLLGQLKAELLEVGGKLEAAENERDKLAKKVAALEKKAKAKGDEPKAEGGS